MTKKRGFKAYLKDRFTTVSTIGSIAVAGAVSGATVPSLGIGGLAIGAATGVAAMIVSNLRHEQIVKNETYALLSGEHDLNDILALASGESDKFLSIEAPKNHLLALKSSIENVNMRKNIFGDLLDPVIHLLTTCINIISLDEPFYRQAGNEAQFYLMIENELPVTLESFYNSSNPAGNNEVREQFKNQILLLTAYTNEIIENYNENRDDKVDINGNYLESKYGEFLKTSENSAKKAS